ncbi:MAG: GNAT family N-acetyltransferase [Chloroflexi bacterium AL-W]|nr:GNAT family N-acetyltransferase [Chloroflexi bacterium AL-N1]NOK66058.1 GNAT family N-acetyltransferase [Chloroflexi bacterium AL-N10]NOK72939.1 GNAT family N-acetyltransferase [Chloroflexi bacterium AL-N5]NOK79836.1 GNAT family N-acetyltransferase [Chloroflexi bacterium AL-W]NOK88308.1 GNAT family N-acetyltransferase [Chloroflexi bacterium AL-N15]
MADMLVKLYELPDVTNLIAQQQAAGIDIRRAIAPEKHVVVNWVRETFQQYWANECDVCFANQPVSCFVAVAEARPIGFACYDATFKNFFGPTGVLESYRGHGIGQVLLLVALHAMAAQGYAYAIIGDVGPTEFYTKAVEAVVIPDSTPGIYRGMLRDQAESDK